jgi:hypothetical protein
VEFAELYNIYIAIDGTHWVPIEKKGNFVPQGKAGLTNL